MAPAHPTDSSTQVVIGAIPLPEWVIMFNKSYSWIVFSSWKNLTSLFFLISVMKLSDNLYYHMCKNYEFEKVMQICVRFGLKWQLSWVDFFFFKATLEHRHCSMEPPSGHV